MISNKDQYIHITIQIIIIKLLRDSTKDDDIKAD